MSAECAHPAEAHETSFGIYFKGMLTDWRLWALGFGTGMVAGAATGALGWGQSYIGGAVGAPMGLYCAMQLGRVRRCGKCGKTVRIPLGQPLPGAQKPPSS